jgi:hypothetical protein
MHQDQSNCVRVMRSGPFSRTARFALVALMAAGVSGLSSSFAQSELPGPEAYTVNRFDKTDELKITGQVLQVDALDSGTIVWMRGTTVVKQGFGVRPGTEPPVGKGKIWRVEGSGVTKVKDATKLTPGTEIVVTGVNSIDKTCEPTCRIRSDKVTLK